MTVSNRNRNLMTKCAAWEDNPTAETAVSALIAEASKEESDG